MKLAWLTDIHLNFLEASERKTFYQGVLAKSPNMLVISGDIGEGNEMLGYLCEMDAAFQRPIYFVLGNHDFYGSSFERSERDAAALCRELPRLVFLDQSNPIALGTSAVLIGHSSWYDMRFGQGEATRAHLNDFWMIKNLTNLSPSERIAIFQARAQCAVTHIAEQLPAALKLARHVYLVTHVPPVPEASRFDNKISNDAFLPLYSCKVLGDLLIEIMNTHPDKLLTVLCGHTHCAAEVQVLPNLLVRVGSAEYKHPILQDLLIIE